MEKEEEGGVCKKKAAENKSVILPFVQGGIAGLYASALEWFGRTIFHCITLHEVSLKRKNAYYYYNKRFPATLLTASTCTTTQFASFQILKQILESGNHGGRPLNLYQEASCGMAAGAIGSIFGCPIFLACSRIEANAKLMSVQQSYSRNLMLNLCHTVMDKGVLAMYRGGGVYTAWAIGHNAGMFASYGRSVSYFKESWGLGKSNSQLGAALVSGFFASACSLPCAHLANAIKYVRQNKELQCRSFLDCTIKSFEIYGSSIFYKGFMNHLYRTTIPVTTMWLCFESVRNAFQNRP